MGFRDTWINHEGYVSCYSETALHAFERVTTDHVVRLLVAGVSNGGALEVWQKCLKDGSTVMGVDKDERCLELRVPVRLADVTDAVSVREALRGCWFDVIVDSTRTMPWTLWPYLSAGGVYIFDGYERDSMLALVSDVTDDVASWLPTEEILNVMVLPDAAIVEKRHPRVVPYLNIISGREEPVVTSEWYVINRRGKRLFKGNMASENNVTS